MEYLRLEEGKMQKIENIGFAGLGLIGGTIARAIRNVYPDNLICAYDPDLAALRESRFDGVIDRAFGSVKELASCDLIFFCAPVAINCENMAALAPYIKEEIILTDVSSVKGSIHKAVRGLGLSGHFIGGHPMTGSERTGYRNSDPALLENAYYLLAPEPEFPEEATVWMNDFIRSLGALPLTVSCEEHDFATAAISHVPHVIAASLVNLVRDSDSPDEIMHTIAAGGFKDITRIASSSPVMWQHILLNNRDNILKLVDSYTAELGKIREAIAAGNADGIYDYFDSARSYRDSFDTIHSRSAHKVYFIHVDIADRPGLIAEVSTILAINNINIKNIGINHNREFQEGVLRVEFNSHEELVTAVKLLQDRRFVVHLPE
jgi:prephenate dehydrogenase